MSSLFKACFLNKHQIFTINIFNYGYMIVEDEVEQIKKLKAEESNEAAELDLGDLLDDLF